MIFYDEHNDFGLIKLDTFGPRILLRDKELRAAGRRRVTIGDRLEFNIAHDDRYIQIATDIRFE